MFLLLSIGAVVAVAVPATLILVKKNKAVQSKSLSVGSGHPYREKVEMTIAPRPWPDPPPKPEPKKVWRDQEGYAHYQFDYEYFPLNGLGGVDRRASFIEIRAKNLADAFEIFYRGRNVKEFFVLKTKQVQIG